MSSAQAFPTAEKTDRLVSLDIFRGLTIAAMVMVNNPGSWGAMYGPLEHSQWDGWTPTDFIFPFFLFIVGVAMTYSFDKRVRSGASKVLLFEQVVRRTIILVLLGLIGYGFPNFRIITPYILFIIGLEFFYKNEPLFTLGDNPTAKRNKVIGILGMLSGILWFAIDFQHFQGGNTSVYDWKSLFPLTNDIGGSPLRIPGVLQRIGVAYFVASIIVLFTNLRGRVAWAVSLLVGYYLIMKFVHAPAGFAIASTGGERGAPVDAPFPGTLNEWIDVKLLGRHIYSERPDPEGILSTITSVATVMMGVLTGNLLQSNQPRTKKALQMLGLGVGCLVLGYLVSFIFPINKKIWSSSFVIFMAGWAMVILSGCYALADVYLYRRWAVPFLVFGTNAILVFFGSGIIGRCILATKYHETVMKEENGVMVETRPWVSLKTGFYNHVIRDPLYQPPKGTAYPHDERLPSFVYSIVYILFWLGVTYPFYRKKIFLKV